MVSARKIAALCAASWLAFAAPAGAQVAISQLPSGTLLTGGEYVPMVQSGTTVKSTPSAFASYIAGLANTWPLTQTFTVAPVFTDQSGSRTALGLGTAATQNTGTSGANVPLLNAANTYSATQAFSGSASTLAATFPNIGEGATVSATAATGTINYDVLTQSVLYYTTNASANWTLNIRGNSSTTLGSLLSTGQVITLAFLVAQGTTAYYNSAVQIDGTATGVTTYWQGGTAPSAGNASGVDGYTFSVIKTGSGTYTVLGSLTQF